MSFTPTMMCTIIVCDYNVIGIDLKDKVVLIGGHYDGKFGGTAATDNGGGSAIVMEAFRILNALDIQLCRTIRAALWGGHEGGRARAGYYRILFVEPLRRS